MYIIKGFIAFPTLTNNDVGEVATLGELSKDSLTFAKETGLYRHSKYNNALLHVFLSQEEQEREVPVPTVYSDAALQLGQWVYDHAVDERFTGSRRDALNDLEVRFEGELTSIEIGVMVTDGTHWMPEWISYHHPDTDTFVRIWFSDTSFAGQYDNYNYVFIPPIDDIDDFFLERSQVLELIAKNGVKQIVGKIDEVRGEYPYTLLRTEEYQWEGGASAEENILTNWTVMIYGRFGNDPDKIRLALIDWILANSKHTRDEWLELFPEIFTPTEFIITPLWHQFAIPNQTIQAGFNSPVVTLGRALEITGITATGIGYSREERLNNTAVARTPTRTLGLLITGSQENLNGVTRFDDFYPDYIGIPTSSRDFGRLSTRTQEWVYVFLKLLQAAETMSEFTIIPAGVSRIVRNGIVYATGEHDGMVWMVATRLSVIKELGIESPYEPEFPEDDDGLGDCNTVEGRIVREHLLYEDNPHSTRRETIGLPHIANQPLLTTAQTKVSVASLLDNVELESEDLKQHLAGSNPHRTLPVMLGLGNRANQALLTLSAVTEDLGIQIEDPTLKPASPVTIPTK